MFCLNRKWINACFNLVCAVVVAFMVGFWFFKYAVEDREIGLVDYPLLKDTNIKFPVTSICFEDPFIDKKLKEINVTISREKYLSYLKGEKSDHDKKYSQIDYDNVTLDLSKYFLFSSALLNNESERKNYSGTIDHINIFNGFYFQSFVKCFTIQFRNQPSRKLKVVRFYYDKNKLLQDWQHFVGSKLKYFMTIHYPGQFFLASFLAIQNGDTYNDLTYQSYVKCQIMEFEIL